MKRVSRTDIHKLFIWLKDGHVLHHVNSHGYHTDPNAASATAIDWSVVEIFFLLGYLVRCTTAEYDKRWKIALNANYKEIERAIDDQEAMEGYLEGAGRTMRKG